jgi:hypothetical protein
MAEAVVDVRDCDFSGMDLSGKVGRAGRGACGGAACGARLRLQRHGPQRQGVARGARRLRGAACEARRGGAAAHAISARLLPVCPPPAGLQRRAHARRQP